MGAEFHPDLKVPDDAVIVSKGMGLAEDGYSAFVGRDDKGRSLVGLLRDLGIERLVVGGLATDYCVLHSVLQGLEAGFAVDVIKDGVRGVEVQPGDTQRAIERMKAAGARFV